MRLSQAYDPKANSVNAIRLVLATAVIFWHSFPLTGSDLAFAPLRQLLSSIWVDGFFAISGFLITGSWLRRPKVTSFLRARVLRIFPGYWMCLLITAFVFAPAMFAADVTFAASLRYVADNALLTQREYGIAGTPVGVPMPGAWNGSMWTLRWEFLCYLGVLVLGVVGLLARRWTVLAVAVMGWTISLLVAAGPLKGFSLPDITFVVGRLPLDDLGRFVLMFTCGALVYQFADQLPISRWWILGAMAITLGSTFLPDYRLLAAPFLAYVLMALGAAIKHPVLRLRNDLSYGMYIYAFPVQQMLATTVLVTVSPWLFGLVAAVITVPLATASWFLVERPASRLKTRRTTG